MEKIRIGKFAITWEGEWEDKEYPPLCAVRYGTGVYLSKTTTSAPPTNIDGWGAMLQSLDEEAVRTLISPDVQTVSVGDITGTSATVTINLQKFGLVVAPSVGVEYRKVGASTWSRTPTQTPTTIGNISINISGMNLVTNYEARAFVVDPKNPDILSVGEVLTFSTTSAYIAMPTVSVSGYPDNISTTPTLTTSAFSAVGAPDTHASTTWRIKNSGGTVVWESPADTTNKTSISIPSGHLQPGTTYAFEAIHIGTALGNSAVGSMVATIANTVFSEFAIIGAGGCGSHGYASGTYGSSGEGGEVIQGEMDMLIDYPYPIVIGASSTPGVGQAGSSSAFGIVARGGVNGVDRTPGQSPGGGYDGYIGISLGVPADPQGGVVWVNGVTYGGVQYCQKDGYFSHATLYGQAGGASSYGYGDTNGMQGIVLLRYQGAVARATGGNISISGGYVYHTFTSSGTFTITG